MTQTQTSVAFENFIVDELLTVRMAESKLAADLKMVGQNDWNALRSASGRLRQLKSRLELLTCLLQEVPTSVASPNADVAPSGRLVLTCA